MKKENIVLIGMPASGKSTVGVLLAKRLGYRFLDTDLLIQEKEGRLLKEIIADVGQDGFLEVENRINASVEAKRSVIAPGGSVIYCEDAMKHFRKIAVIVYLKVSFEELTKRLGDVVDRGVVLKEGMTLRDLYDERCALYDQYAQVTVNENEMRAGEVVDYLREYFEKTCH